MVYEHIFLKGIFLFIVGIFVCLFCAWSFFFPFCTICSEMVFLGLFVLWRFVCWGCEESLIQVVFSYFVNQFSCPGLVKEHIGSVFNAIIDQTHQVF